MLREQAHFLANVLEIKWHQRARTKWLSSGDRNTSYFHAVATTKKKLKYISEIKLQDKVISDSTEILQAFTSFYTQLLGTHEEVLPLNCETLYSGEPALHDLAAPFTEREIRRAVLGLANNKASGPDGLPNEFAKLQWDVLKLDLLEIFNSLHEGTLSLENHNLAHIVLIPKGENPTDLSSFRPISILNYLPKLISKVLANRLANFISTLISNEQTGFVKGRLISENFNTARELIGHISKSKVEAVMFKLDFYKAFDSVSWSFLFNVLHARGFPAIFISWIKLVLSSSRSSILLNGQVGVPFEHKRGLRQGDPLSPFLFLLAVDVLSRMITAASLSVPYTISSRFLSPFFLLQYADDTMLFSTVKGTAIHTLQLVLHIFSKVSGLKINLSKSAFVPFNLQQNTVRDIEVMLNCKPTTLPISYLGLPLTAKKPDRAAYQMLIDKIRNKLATWKSGFISRAGRVVLVKAVLSAVPIYFMSVFKLPIWVVKAIDRIRRDFIWGGAQGRGGKLHLISWDLLCQPKSIGGLGLSNIITQNNSLLLRWIWRLYDAPDSLWTRVTSILYSKQDQCIPPLLWNAEGSFFWKELRRLRYLFQLSTNATIANGATISFWYDDWMGKRLAYFLPGHTKPTKPLLLLQQARSDWFGCFQTPHNFQIQQARDFISQLNMEGEGDRLRWRWSSSGEFSVSSVYKALTTAGKTRFKVEMIWKIKVPPSIKLFLFFLAHDKLSTQENLLKRHLFIPIGCKLCQNPAVETAEHLFFKCPMAVQLFTDLTRIWGSLQLRTGTSLLDTLQCSFQRIGKENFTAVIFATALYALWIERNNRIFRDKTRSMFQIKEWVITEARSYFKHS
ncbi:hypothetical protein LUZ61_014626 [Rhynchospora tenuis]|uniref:Reverse transcriptase domain-containing protein n=1 Tax=Rhynchospora tenuis TaxID=198213 RepID=A0AAD5Z2Q7_9POAL|nr:hypothetical protein LUZ61_014626 [Rhynchospora tenuis]